jgi:DNA-binding transcriptional MerR regulator
MRDRHEDRRTREAFRTNRPYDPLLRADRADALRRRDRSSQRDYDASILVWIEFLGRLKTTGMPIRDMLRYAELRERGNGTEAGRRALLERHRESVRAHIDELNACLLVLDTKIGGYAETEQRMKDYDATRFERRRKPVGARTARTR